jgi:hypothetical protein
MMYGYRRFLKDCKCISKDERSVLQESYLSCNSAIDVKARDSYSTVTNTYVLELETP